MRKSIIVAASSFVLLVGGGVTAWYWTQSRALAEVDIQFATLRAAGATAEHGPVAFEPWSRTLTIGGIKIKSAGTPAIAFAIKQLTFTGVEVLSSAFAAARVDIDTMDVDRTAPEPAGITIRAKVPSLVAEKLTIPSRAQTIGALVQGVRADTISVPAIDAVATLPTPAQPATRTTPPRPAGVGEFKYQYTGSKLNQIGDGRIALYEIGKLSFSGITGSGSMAAGKVEDIDLLPFFSTDLATRKPVDGYYRVQGKQAMGALTMSMPDGGSVTFGSMTSAGASIDPTRVSVAALTEMIAAASANPLQRSPTQNAAFAEMIAKLYQGIAIDRFEMRDMEVKPAANGSSGNVRMNAFVMDRLKNGKIDTFGFEGLTGDMPTMALGRPDAAALKVGKFAIDGLDVAGLMRWGSAMQPGAGGVPPDPTVMLTLIKSVELHDAVIPDPLKGTTTKIDRLKLSWDRFVLGGLPADIRLSFKGEAPVNPADPMQAELAKLGFRSILVDIDLGSRFDPQARELTLAPLDIKMDQLGTLSGQITLANVPLQAYSVLPNRFTSAFPAFTIKGIDLVLRDGGSVALFNARRTLGAPPASPAPPATSPPPVAPAGPPSSLAQLTDAATRFGDKPGQSLTLKLVPKQPVRIGDLLAGGITSPETLAIMDRFDIQVEMKP